ncbi:MAG: TonB-dependent receptor domain-containing protein [Myxococcota bacterium]
MSIPFLRSLKLRLSFLLAALSASHAALGQSSAPVSEEAQRPRLTKPPKLVTFVDAEYPESEKAAGKGAAVVLQIGITADGTVSEVNVIESAGAAFDAAAVAAARRFVFEPAEINDKPAPIRINYRYQFVLRDAVPTTAILAGSVRARKTGEPLAGVTLELDDGTRQVTDAAGHFEFRELQPGRRRILLSRADLKALQTEEELVAGQKLDAIYEIELAPVEEAEDQDDLEIVVTAPKLIKQTVSTKVEAEEGRRVAGTQGDVLKIVENLPGVARSSAGSSQIVVWGAAPEDTRVYVDGVRVPLLYHFGGFRSVIHTDLVNSVELVPGGYGARYGRGLGGLVAVATRDPARDVLHASAQLDAIDASAAAQGPLGKSWSFALAGRRSHLDWVLQRVTSKDIGEFFQIPRYYDGQLRLRRALGENEFVEVTGLLSSDRVDRTVQSADPANRKHERRSQNFQRISARYKKTNNDGSSVEVLPWVGRDFKELESRFGPVPTSVSLTSRLFGARATWTGRVLESTVATVGIDLEASNVDGKRAGSMSSPPREGDARAFGQPPSDQIALDEWSAFIGSAAPFVELDVAAFKDALHITPGLRFDPLFTSVSRRTPREGNNPGIGAYSADFAVEPRLSLRYALSRRASLRAAYGEYRQPPLPEDLSPVFGNPLLSASRARHVLGGGDFQLSQSFALETTVFYTESQGLAARNPLPSPLIAQALVGIGEGRSFGAQFLLRRNLRNGFFGWVAYTLLRAERKDRPDAAFRLFDYDQTHVLTAVAAYQLGRGFDVSARVRVASGYPRTPVVASYYDARRNLYVPVLGEHNGDRLPDFVQLDVRIAKRWKLGNGELEAYLDVQNVSNRENPEEVAYSPDYSERRYVNGLPILPVLGAKWSF